MKTLEWSLVQAIMRTEGTWIKQHCKLMSTQDALQPLFCNAPQTTARSKVYGCMSYSPSSSSNSPSSSAVASWYCWYSETRSFMLLSASVNSISSIPSPVYQCKKALRRNIAVKYSATRLNISWIAVEFPAKATANLRPLGGMSQTEALILFGIHSTKYDEFLFWTFNICSSTSFVLIRPRNNAAAVRYRPCRGSAAHIMFLASNICCVSSDTVSARYCCEPRDVRGAKPVMKKCKRGNGIRLTAILRRSQLSCPGKRRHVVTPLIAALTKWLRSPYVGVVSFKVRKQISYKASLSSKKHSSAFSTSWWNDNTALYGSTTVSETFGDGITENVSMMRSGYSSRTLEIKSVPMPAPVPPPREWQSWNPWRQSQPSASLRTTSRTESINSAPSV